MDAKPPDGHEAPPGKKYQFKVPKTLADLQHKGEHFFHCAYLGAVGYEAHGMYQMMAIIVLVFTLAGVFMVNAEH